MVVLTSFAKLRADARFFSLRLDPVSHVPQMAGEGGACCLQSRGGERKRVFDSASFVRVSRRSFPSFGVVLFRWFLAFPMADVFWIRMG